MKDYNIEGHKLIYHPGRVQEWLEGGNIYPIYIEISPTNACNHDCSFCALSYCRKDNIFLGKNMLIKKIIEMANVGIHSIMYAGEGEPLIHPDIEEIILKSKKTGMDVALTTNGVLLKNTNTKKILEALTWIRISLNAGTSETYARIHRCDKNDFGKVLENICNLVLTKRKFNLYCDIGVQIILLPENKHEILTLAKLLKKKGINYFIIKPYSEHPKNKINRYKKMDYAKYLDLEKQLMKIQNNNFQVIFRKHTLLKSFYKKPYKKCQGLPFFTFINSKGNLYPCASFINDDKFIYGNIYEQSFKQIWNGKKRKSVLSRFNNFLLTECRRLCRLDEINCYLWRLKHPTDHVNFI